MTRAWHFCADRGGRPVLRDGRPVVVDEWLTHDGPLVPCESGLHASARAIDALRYAPGPWVCLVDCDGEIIEHGDPVDKLACRRRRAVACIDATEALRMFARQCALDVAHLWNMPDLVRRYLETGNETIRDAARAAAWAAAEDAAEDAAAWAAARAAARAAAWAAARATLAAGDATLAAGDATLAAGDATLAAARERQNANLESLFYQCMYDAGLVSP